MVSKRQALESNRKRWDALVPMHFRSRFYSVEEFKVTKNSLQSVELAEVGNVRGKELLHLQSHFGMDTLSWARLGARATGVDFSPEAIRTAKSLSRELGIPARFVCSDIYDLPRHLKGKRLCRNSSSGRCPGFIPRWPGPRGRGTPTPYSALRWATSPIVPTMLIARLML